MPSMQVNQTQLEYVERGEGEPVVLVHGSLGDLRSWQLQTDAFAQRHRVVSYSRRHHHPNPCADDQPGYSAAVHADDLATLMAGLGLESAHVVGSSYGAYTALLLALSHPERVRALVLSEPPVLPLLEHHPEGRVLRERFLTSVWAPAGETLQRGHLEDGVRTFVDGLFERGAFDQLPDEVHDLIMDNAAEFRLETASPEFWTPFRCEDAARVQAPTLLLSGGQSLRMLQLVVEELARCLPDNEHVRFPDSSHDLPGEAAETFNEIVLDFLARHSS